MFKLSRQQKDHRYFCGNRYEKYSIKKLKVGAASVLIGAGFLFGYNVDTVEAASATETTEAVVTKDADTGLNQVQENTQAGTVSESKSDSETTSELAEQPKINEEKSVEPAKPVKENEKEAEQASAVSEHTNTAEATETKPSINLSLLQTKLADLEAQIERIRGNKKQASQIQNAEKLVAEAKQYLGTLDATQSGADKKAKEISSLTSILKSIKAEETPKENKNQDSRNGKKMEEGVSFREGVTSQAISGDVHFDSHNGPTEKQIPVANGGNGSRYQKVSITYSASSDETVVDGKVRITVPKEFLHSKSQPEFKHSTFVKKVEDKSTEDAYIYELSLNPMTGGTVAESEMKLQIGTSIKNAPSNGDRLPITVELGTGDNYTVSKTITATFDYLSEILYRESDTRTKEVGSFIFGNLYIDYTKPEAEWKLGNVIDGTFKPVENATYKLPFIAANTAYIRNREADENGTASHNGNGRLLKYDYTISGIPDIFEIAPGMRGSDRWKLENGVATFIPENGVSEGTNTNDYALYLRLKKGVLTTSDEIQKYIDTTPTKGYLPPITYTAVGHRPDGSTFTQELPSNNAFRVYASNGLSTIGSLYTYIWTPSNQKLYSNQSDTDTFRASVRLEDSQMKGDGGIFSGNFVNYFIPKDQKDNYFTSVRLGDFKYAKLNANGSKSTIDYTDASGTLVKPFKLYGINEQNQPELIKEYSNAEEMATTIKLDSSKHYQHLVLEHSGIEDKYYKDGEKIKIKEFNAFLDVKVPSWKEKSEDDKITSYKNRINLSFSENLTQASNEVRPQTGKFREAVHNKTPYELSLEMNVLNGRGVNSKDISRGKILPVIVSYHATDYFKSLNESENGVQTRNLSKLDPNITETKIMLLADPKVPLKDFRVTTDNRLLTTDVVYTPNEGRALYDYDKIKEKYTTVIPTRTIPNYKNTGKTAYIFDTKDLGITKYDVSENITAEQGYRPVALTFEVENNGLVESNTYNIESYLVWNSNSQTLKGRDRSLNSDYVDGHESGNTISRASVDVKFTNVIEYYTALGISKPGTPVVRGIIDVVNGNEVTLTPTIQNLTDNPQQIKEAVVLVPKKEAVTYLEGPIVDKSDSWDVVYTTSTVEDKTTATYVTADQISNWKDVTAVKYVFKSDYQVTKETPFVDHFNVRVDQQNANFIQSTSQIFLKNASNTWLESNVVGLRTEDIRGKVISRYYTTSGLDLSPRDSEARRTTEGFANEPYTTNKNDVMNKNGRTYIYKELDPTSATPSGTYEKQVTKKVTYLYEEAKEVTETKKVKRTINYLEKNNETNVISQPVEQVVTASRKVYTGKETGRVVEGNWEIPANAKWESVTSPTPSEWEKPEVKVNDQYIAKAAIDEVRITPEVLNNGDIIENVYYERFVPVGGDVVAKYVIEGTTTELKPATDVAKGLKVGTGYTSTAPVAGEELTDTDGKVYVYKGHKATSAGEQGTVTADKQEVVYEYAPKVGGNVEVKYVIAGTETNLKDPVALVTDGQVGSDYTATKENTLTKDGLVYELVKTNNGLKAGSAPETGKVTEAKQEVVYEYAPKVGGNVEVKYVIAGTETNLKDPVALVTDGQVGSDYTATKDATIRKEDGRVYKLVEANNGLKTGSAAEIGKVSTEKQTVTYEYVLQNGDVTVKYEDETGNAISTPNELRKGVETGTAYDTTPETVKKPRIQTADGKVYKLKETKADSAPETGKVSDSPAVITYVYTLENGDVTVKYEDETGTAISTPNELKKGVETGTAYDTTPETVKKPRIQTADGKVYKLKEIKADSAPETGKVSDSPAVITYVYTLQNGDVTVKYEDEAGTAISTPNELKKGVETGTAYDTTPETVKKPRIQTADGKVYKLKETKADSAPETGKVSDSPAVITYVYTLENGDVTVKYEDETGTAISTPNELKKGVETGTAYDTTPETVKKPRIQTADGKVYKLKEIKADSAPETGKVSDSPAVITYVYTLQNGDVTVKYEDEAGTAISTPNELKKGVETGTAYDTTPETVKKPRIQTADGKVYKLKETKADSAPETGKVSDSPAVITYVYTLENGDVTVKYENEAGESIKSDNHLKSQVPTGDDYNTTTVKDLTITKDGKLYKLVEKNGGVKEGSSEENGKVTETLTVVTYVYTEVKGEIIQKFVNESGKEIKDPTNTGKKSLNEKVNLEHPNRITDKDGKVYEFVKVDKIPTNFTEQPQTATYTYRAVKGQGVTVSYETTTGVTLKETQTVQPKDTVVGTDYDTSTSDFKPERIEKDGKVYILTATTKPGSAEEKGKVSEQPQNVTYVYEEVPEHETKQKYGNVIVTYVDKAGRPLSGTTETGVKVDKSVIDTPASLVKTPYDTTDNKPETITTADGKVYKFVKVTQYSDAEKSDVKGRTSVVTYVYELQNATEELPEAHIGFVVVNYVDENGLSISGTSEGREIPTTVMDVNGDLVGTQYDTTDHKPTTITTADGDVYEFVKKSETSDPESGELKEGVATVEYVYRKVVTTYVDETGKEINPSDKGTKDKKNIPEYIYKETKKDEKGNTRHVYRQVITSYVNEEGKEINPSDKGTKDKKDIPEYTFKETKKDKDGNTIHVYTKKSSSTPYSPTPSTPSNEESKSTVWKDTEGNILKPQEDGTKDKGTFTGYEYVKTILVGNVTTHIFKKVITPSHDGTPSRPEVPGQSDKPNHPDVPGQSDTPDHSDVTVTPDKSTQIANSNESTFVDGKRELPNTGTQSSTSSLLLGALAAMTGLGLVSRRRKDDKE